MKLTPFLALVVIVSLFMASCKEKKANGIYINPPAVDVKPDTTKAETSKIKKLFAATRVQSQIFSGNAENVIRIEGEKGTRITIPSSSLLHQDDSPVTGAVDFELKEIYTPGQMILANAVTVSNGEFLQSGGEIYFMARQNGEKLKINPAKPMQVLFASTSPVYGMQLFTGQFSKDASVAPDTSMNWSLAGSDSARIARDTSGTAYGYLFNTDKLGWVNCDRYPNIGGAADPAVKLPDGFDDENAAVYIVFTDYNIVAAFSNYDSSTKIFKLYNGQNAGEGLNVAIVAIAEKDKKYYYKIFNTVTAAGQVIELDMDEATVAEIEAAVGSL